MSASPKGIRNKARFTWIISRVRRIFEFWDNGLEECDKAYCLRRIRDKEPELFYRIAQEKSHD